LGKLKKMPGGAGHLVQVIPERPRKVGLNIPLFSSPGNARDSFEALPLPDPFANLRQRLLSFSSNNHVDPGVAVKNLPVIKGNMRPSPYGNRLGGETFHFLENFGGHG
jgi:hypothetical protein